MPTPPIVQELISYEPAVAALDPQENEVLYGRAGYLYVLLYARRAAIGAAGGVAPQLAAAAGRVAAHIVETGGEQRQVLVVDAAASTRLAEFSARINECCHHICHHWLGCRGWCIQLHVRILCYALMHTASASPCSPSRACSCIHCAPTEESVVPSAAALQMSCLMRLLHSGCCRAGKRNMNMPGTPPSHGLMYCWHGKSSSGLRCFSYLINQ